MATHKIDSYDDDMNEMLDGFGVEELVHFNMLLCANGEKEYQRPVDMMRVKKIADNFDPRLFNRIVVSRRSDGYYYIIDGQHRYKALRLTKRYTGTLREQVPCIVFNTLSYEDEQYLFHQLNSTRKALTPYQLHRSGGQIARDIDRLLAEYGLRLVEGRQGNYNRGTVAAVQTIYTIYRSRGIQRNRQPGDALRDLLDIITQVWHTEESARGAVQKPMLVGLHSFLLRASSDPNYDRERLIKQLNTVEPQYLFRLARDKADAMRESTDSMVAIVIHQLYNKGLRSRLLGDIKINSQKKSGNEE